MLQPSVVATPLALSTAAAAATFRVDRTDDEPAATACEDAEPNDCSLRGATLRANAASPPARTSAAVPLRIRSAHCQTGR